MLSQRTWGFWEQVCDGEPFWEWWGRRPRLRALSREGVRGGELGASESGLEEAMAIV